MKKRYLSFTFDDGFINSAKKIDKILRLYKATFYIVTGWVKPNIAPINDPYNIGKDHGSLNEWKKLAKKGHDVGSHTVSHIKADNINTKKEYYKSLKFIKKIQDPPYSFSSPWYMNLTTRAPYDSIRLGKGEKIYNNLEKINLHKINSWEPFNGKRKLKDISKIISKIPNNSWLVLTMHGIDNEGYNPVKSDELRRLLKFIIKEKFEIKTIKEMTNLLKNNGSIYYKQDIKKINLEDPTVLLYIKKWLKEEKILNQIQIESKIEKIQKKTQKNLKFKKFYNNLFLKYIRFIQSIKIKIYKKQIKDYITIIITSSGRKKYLKKTIESLKENIIYNKKKILWYIIDDCPSEPNTRNYFKGLDFDLILFNKKNKGLGYSLNRIYPHVKTKYVFHCEDDWEFLKPIHIKKMIDILENNHSLGQLILSREFYWKKRASSIIKTNNKYVEFPNYFSFNPHLAKYEVFQKNFPFPLINTEDEWTKKVRCSGYSSGIYGYKERKIFVKHLGKIKKTIIY